MNGVGEVLSILNGWSRQHLCWRAETQAGLPFIHSGSVTTPAGLRFNAVNLSQKHEKLDGGVVLSSEALELTSTVIQMAWSVERNIEDKHTNAWGNRPEDIQ